MRNIILLVILIFSSKVYSQCPYGVPPGVDVVSQNVSICPNVPIKIIIEPSPAYYGYMITTFPDIKDVLVTYYIIGVNANISTTVPATFVSNGFSASATIIIDPPIGGWNVGSSQLTVTQVYIPSRSCITNLMTIPATSIIDVVAGPNISGVNSVNVAQPLCVGNDGIVSFNSSNLSNGSYTLTYSLTGTNNSWFYLSTNINISGGMGSFIIPKANIPNIGITTINLINISNALCDMSFIPSVTNSFIISPLPNVEGTNSVTVAQPLCASTNATATLNSSLVTNGTYTVTYSLSGANTLASSTASVTFTSGVGTFNVPASQIPNVGTTNISVSALANSTSGCSSTYGTAVTGSFNISPLPNTTGTNTLN